MTILSIMKIECLRLSIWSLFGDRDLARLMGVDKMFHDGTFPVIEAMYVHAMDGTLRRPQYSRKFICTTYEQLDAVPKIRCQSLQLIPSNPRVWVESVLSRLTDYQSLQDLHFSGEVKWTESLKCSVLPAALKTLWLGRSYKYALGENVLPSNLHKLAIESNIPLPEALPQGLKTLVLTGDFDNPIDASCLPDTIVFLVIGHSFNQPLHDVFIRCPGLQQLKFEGSFNRFNQSLDGIRNLENLHTLMIGNSMSKTLLAITLPASLTELWCGNKFNSDFNRRLPKLKKVHVGKIWCKSLSILATHMPCLQAIYLGSRFLSETPVLIPNVDIYRKAESEEETRRFF
jgi:hypothetical protein